MPGITMIMYQYTIRLNEINKIPYMNNFKIIHIKIHYQNTLTDSTLTNSELSLITFYEETDCF